ncbi:DUF2023 family protein [Halosquirtibacter xylanolyticus]|uniref:DUF2023 family protein n=1 Tax=Halosquirtibacter xylanolyticus TaxID=3374599 RepID=UPI00374A196D|nr:DUF2023 family protein [Prolixibacteraceae bacterium]
MKVFVHHVYEYKKGLRNLVLHTMGRMMVQEAIKRLEGSNIDYHIQDVTNSKVNVFFGAKECVKIVKKICDKPLNELSAEEDFMLGIMLGYDRKVQCERYLSRSQYAKVMAS